MTFLDVRPPVDLVDPYGRTASRAVRAATDDGGALFVVVFTGHPGGRQAAPKGEAAPTVRVTYRGPVEGPFRFPTFPEIHRAVREVEPDVGFAFGPVNPWDPEPAPDADAGVWLLGLARRGAPGPSLVKA